MLVALPEPPLWFALQEDPWGAGRRHGNVGAPGDGCPWRWVPLPPNAVGQNGTSHHGVRRGLAAVGPLAEQPHFKCKRNEKQQPPKIPPPSPLKQLNVSSYYIKIHFSKYSKSSYEIHGRLVSFPYKKACAQRRRQRKACLFLSKHNQILQFVTKACIPCCRWKESHGGLCPEPAASLAAPIPSWESGAGEHQCCGGGQGWVLE